MLIECHMYMAAYVSPLFRSQANGSTVWMLQRSSDDAVWISPEAGTPLGPDSNYLRVVAASCYGCNFGNLGQWNCDAYNPAPTQTTSPSIEGGFAEFFIIIHSLLVPIGQKIRHTIGGIDQWGSG